MYDTIGENAILAAKQTSCMLTDVKNKILSFAADELEKHAIKIIAENEKDVALAKENGVKESLIDRLILTDKRIKDIANALRNITMLPDPVGETITMKTMPNGLMVGQRRVPFGVIGIIYESRPNVTVDSFGICLKSGNAVVLRGGKDAINTNKVIASILRYSCKELGYSENIVQLIEDTSRESAIAVMKMDKYIDVLIPRGGAGLIRSVVENSTVPIIETGVGNCHIYVDEKADLTKAFKITINAKTSRPGVCNACEKLIIHRSVLNEFLPTIISGLRKHNVEIVGDSEVKNKDDSIIMATEKDWGTEYLDHKIGIKVVGDIAEAIDHIEKYSTGHSEAIITESYSNAMRFTNEVDSAAVYVNASTRFTDGGEFGFGAEIGISTQKLHARGPMGLRELTTSKYVIYGDGQIRE